ncbi:coil containing protein [Vibrio phage 1.264.O._10N.286.51.F2]|nr:coil containing protein [Vibrio phage 1.264.O._10N.286.51.F2]
MSMTTKVGDVVRLDSPHGSYRGKFTAGHIGVVTAIHAANDPFGGHQWVNLDDESGAPLWNPTTNMTTVEANSMLLEDVINSADSRDGDVLVAHHDNDNEFNGLEAGDLYTLSLDSCGCCGYAVDEDGDMRHASDDDFWFVNLSATKRNAEPVTMAEVIPYPTAIFLDEGVERIAPPTPKYDDMDNAAKGSILLAAHEGKVIQFMSRSGGFWVDDTSFEPSENFAYRVKPQELIDAEEALNAATSNVVSLEDARDKADSEVSLAEYHAEMARAAWASADLEYASVKDTVEALRAA